MLPLRDAVSILPQLSLAAVLTNSTTDATARTTTVVETIGNSTNVSSPNDAAAKLLLALFVPSGILPARTLHAVLVAANLFWYQAIRQTVAVLSVFMCEEYADRGMDTSQQARLIAAPSVGNILTQAVGGLVVRSLPGGTKTAITIALVGLATGCTMLPLAINPGAPTTTGAQSFPLGKAFALLSLQGFLFGPMFPSHSVLLSKWLPPNERGSAMAYGEIAMSLASMGVPLVVTSIAEYTARPASNDDAEGGKTVVAGWRNGFYATGVACFGYLIAWIVLGRNEPDSCSYISKNELDLIRSVQTKSVGGGDHERDTGAATKGDRDSPPPTPTKDFPWQRVLLHPSITSLFFVHMVYNFVTLSVNSWMPTYYNDVLKLNPNDAKLHIVLPQLTGLVVKLGVSEFARFLRRRMRAQNPKSNSNNNATAENDERSVILFSRRFMGYLGFAIMALSLSMLPLVAPSASATDPKNLSSPWWSTGLFSAALAGTGCHAESFRANYLDVTQEHVGLVSGVGNCLSSLSAMLAPFIVGRLIASGDWSPVWKLSAVVSVLAALVFGTFSTTTPIEEGGQQT